MGSRLLNLIFLFTLDDARERRRRLSVSFRRRLRLLESDRAVGAGFEHDGVRNQGQESGSGLSLDSSEPTAISREGENGTGWFNFKSGPPGRTKATS